MIDPDRDDPLELDAGADTDGDGRPDTAVLPDPVDLVLAVDTDHDGLADLLLRLGADGELSPEVPDPAAPLWWDDLEDVGVDACYAPFGDGHPGSPI